MYIDWRVCLKLYLKIEKGLILCGYNKLNNNVKRFYFLWLL